MVPLRNRRLLVLCFSKVDYMSSSWVITEVIIDNLLCVIAESFVFWVLKSCLLHYCLLGKEWWCSFKSVRSNTLYLKNALLLVLWRKSFNSQLHKYHLSMHLDTSVSEWGFETVLNTGSIDLYCAFLHIGVMLFWVLTFPRNVTCSGRHITSTETWQSFKRHVQNVVKKFKKFETSHE